MAGVEYMAMVKSIARYNIIYDVTELWDTRARRTWILTDMVDPEGYDMTSQPRIDFSKDDLLGIGRLVDSLIQYFQCFLQLGLWVSPFNGRWA